MLTQCPHCLTLFRIAPEQLKAAAGKVRCSRCNQVFNALHRLEETPESFLQKANAGDDDFWPEETETPADDDTDEQVWENDAGADADTPAEPVESNADTEENEPASYASMAPAQADVASEFDLDSDSESDFILERDDGLETEPDYFAADTESQMSALLDQDTNSSLLNLDDPSGEPAEVIDFLHREATQPQADETASEADETTPEEAEPPVEEDEPEPGESELPPGYDFGDSILKDEAIDLEEGKPDYDSVPAFRASIDEPVSPPASAPVDESVFAFEPIEKPARQRSPATPFWFAGSLVLLLLLGGQLVWLFKDSLIRHDMGRQAVSALCQVVGCTVPIRRDTDKIVIQSRNLSTHPDMPDVLFMQLVMINNAGFAQPFPKVQLSLFNDKGALIARRTFAPDDYLPQDERGKRMMPESQPIQVEMQLRDPGKEVTGYTFEFL
ncbi:MAG: DUF3426 domain-containing protein [Candidatus Thiodiazotropha sp.]